MVFNCFYYSIVKKWFKFNFICVLIYLRIFTRLCILVILEF